MFISLIKVRPKDAKGGNHIAKIEKGDIRLPPKNSSTVTLKTSGNIIEMRYMTNSVSDFPIQRIDNDSYVIPSEGTGEVHSFNHSENRADNIDNVRQSLKHLRDLINANTEHPKRVLWVTLTYSENMSDNKRLYKDFHSFWLRFKRFTTKQFGTVPEYITAAEPQARARFICIA